LLLLFIVPISYATQEDGISESFNWITLEQVQNRVFAQIPHAGNQQLNYGGMNLSIMAHVESKQHNSD